MSSLSAEALRDLQGLSLEEVRKDLSFTPAEEKKRLTVDLDWMEQISVSRLDFSSVLEKLNALGTKPAPREDVVLPEIKTEADQPDWLTSDTSDEEASAAPRTPLWQEEPQQKEEPTPREAWDQLPADQRNNDLGDWYNQWQEGSEPEDWQKQALKEFNVWAGDEPPAPVDHAEEDDSNSLPSTEEDKKLFSAEGIKVAVKSYLSSWFDKNRVQIFANLGGGAAVGFLANMCFTEIIAQNRQMASFLPHLLTELQSASILTTNAVDVSIATALTMRGKRELFEKHLKAASLAEQLAISRSVDNQIDRLLIIVPAAAKFVRGITLHPGTMGFVSGAWLYAALSGAGVFGESGLTHQAHAVVPADSGGAGAGAGQEQTGGHSAQPDMESLRARGKIEIPDSSAGQPPADQPSPAGDWTGVDEQLKVQAQAQAEAAKQAVLEARQQMVNSSPHNIKVSDLLPENQVGANHWKLAELWTKPLGDSFELSEAGRTFFTDAVKDITQNQGNVLAGTVVNYDNQKIGDYLAEALGRLQETDSAGWIVKVTKEDINKMYEIADLLKNSK